MEKQIGIIDYNCGNLASLHNALERTECKFGYISKLEDFSLYSAYILPGVGAFRYGMESLVKKHFDSILLEEIKHGKKVLGICLGMQLLFEDSLEGGFQNGLGFVPGNVRQIKTKGKCRIPHMGWNNIEIDDGNEIKIFDDIDKESSYYFVHSYGVDCGNNDIMKAQVNYCGDKFLAAFEFENISGVQFHPEKSHDAGLKLLDNFCNRL